jgi:sugar phosphate isomerase/epimerase
MKLAGCTILYLDYATLDETMRRFAKFGYRGVDIWADSPHLDPLFDRGDRQDTKKLAGDLGLEIVALALNGGPLARRYNFAHAHSWVREETTDYYLKCIDLAAELGCPLINLISGAMPFGVTKEQAWPWHIDCIGRVCEHAEQANVTVALHTAPPNVSRVLTYLDDAIQLREDLNSPAAKIMIDTASQYVTEPNFADAIRKVADHLCYFHLCDTKPDGTPGHEPLGTGVIDFQNIVSTLKEVGYNQWMTVQLDAFVTPIDPDAWMISSYDHIKTVMQECGVWEG